MCALICAEQARCQPTVGASEVCLACTHLSALKVVQRHFLPPLSPRNGGDGPRTAPWRNRSRVEVCQQLASLARSQTASLVRHKLVLPRSQPCSAFRHPSSRARLGCRHHRAASRERPGHAHTDDENPPSSPAASSPLGRVHELGLVWVTWRAGRGFYNADVAAGGVPTRHTRETAYPLGMYTQAESQIHVAKHPSTLSYGGGMHHPFSPRPTRREHFRADGSLSVRFFYSFSVWFAKLKLQCSLLRHKPAAPDT